MIEHWNGKQWTTSPIPDGLENSFNSVTAVSANDVWAVGSTNESSGPPTLAVHWDGAAWNTVEIASATTQCQNELIATTTVPYSNQVWAVGDYVSNCRNSNGSLLIQPLIETNGS